MTWKIILLTINGYLITFYTLILYKIKNAFMKSLFKLSFTVIAFSLIFSACKNKSNDAGKMIPKNALIIIDLNSKSLSSKLPWDEIKQTTWFNHHYNDSSMPVWTKAIMDDPQKAGIDLKNDLIFFFLKNMDDAQIVCEGDVKNSKTFGDFIKNLNTKATINKEGDLNTFILDKGVAAWNDKKFALLTNAPKHSMQMDDTTKSAAPLVSPNDNLLRVCKTLFSLSSDTSMEKNEKFTALLKEDGDIHYWQNTEELVKSSMNTAMGMMGMLKLDAFFKENISTITANFDDGKISFKQKMYAGKEFTDVLKKMNKSNINTDMIKNISSQNLAAVIAWHFNPEGFLDLIKLTGMDGFINIFLAQQGLTLDDVVKATKGDVVFAVSDLKPKKDSTKTDTVYGMRNERAFLPNATFLFSTSIADKDAFNKVINAVKKLDKTGNSAQQNYKMSDAYFVAGNSPDAINSFLAGNKTVPAFLDKIKDHPAGGFADIKMIIKSFEGSLTKDSSAKTLYDINLKMWDNAFFTGGEFKDGAVTGNAEINLMDKTTNSLKQLNKYFDGMAKVMIEEKENHKEEWKKDSTNIMHSDTVLNKNNTHHKPSKK